MIGRDEGKLIAAGSGKCIVENLYVADHFWTRFLGLQFRRELQPDTGLLIYPATSIHMFWMRFPINLLFLDREGVVVEIHPNVRPWSVVFCQEKNAVAALELSVEAELANIGEKLVLAEQPEALEELMK